MTAQQNQVDGFKAHKQVVLSEALKMINSGITGDRMAQYSDKTLQEHARLKTPSKEEFIKNFKLYV